MRPPSATLRLVIGLALAVLADGASARAPEGEFARALTRYANLEGRVMWIDATANLDRIFTREGVADVVARCRKANLTTLVVDVKPACGQVVFPSKIAERLREWKGRTLPDFDVIGAFVEEGHRAGLEVAATFNVLSEGHKFYKVGLAYQHPDWQSVAYVVDRGLIAPDSSRLPIRAAVEPEDPLRPTMYGEDFVQQPAPTAGKALTVLLDADRRVAGMVDPALLGEEPLGAPDDGYALTLSGDSAVWAEAHLSPGSRIRLDAAGKRVPGTESASERVAAFINPLHPDARRHEIALLCEVARNYDVDAIVFDRMRYANLQNDFGDITKAAFERWLGRAVPAWPDDVLRFNPIPGEPFKRGPLFRPWLEFRAHVIRQFAREATQSIRAIKPGIQIGAYVGSWFNEYYPSGANWGSEKYNVDTAWATPDYNEAGYAEFLTWLSTGCYYAISTREEARRLDKEEGGTVEASAELSTRAVANAVPVYAGLYALTYARRPQDFVRAIEVASRRSHGVMIFDLSYIYDYGWWNLLEQAFPQPALAPHRVPGLSVQLRGAFDAVRGARDGSGGALPVVPGVAGGG